MRQTDEQRRDDKDEDDVDERRVAYLRQHRAMLEQKQRLETERRIQEIEQDEAEIRKRLDGIRVLQQRQKEQQQQITKTGLPLVIRPEKTTTLSVTRLPDIYARIDDLNAEALRVIAEKQPLCEVASLNTQGKYHTRYMKNPYPIGGSQIKLEKERELGVAAKKKLLLSTNMDSTETTLARQALRSSSSAKFASSSYRKLDYYADKMTAVLLKEEEHVHQYKADRQIRLLEVKHMEGLEQFWRLFNSSHKRELVAWLKTHSFRDVNIPVLLVAESDGYLTIQPDRTLGLTPLMAACRSHSVELVYELLAQDAVVNLTTVHGDSALHFLWRDWTDTSTNSLKEATSTVIRANNVHEILKGLVDHKADVNAQNDFGETALQFCARYGLKDCAKLLLAHGADPYLLDRKRNNALVYANENKHDELHRMLLNYSTIERVKDCALQRQQYEILLQQKRGALTANWSQPPEVLLGRLIVEDQRVGHLRNQYVDRRGQVIICTDDDDDDIKK